MCGAGIRFVCAGSCVGRLGRLQVGAIDGDWIIDRPSALYATKWVVVGQVPATSPDGPTPVAAAGGINSFGLLVEKRVDDPLIATNVHAAESTSAAG